jgi:hypothetical protein
MNVKYTYKLNTRNNILNIRTLEQNSEDNETHRQNDWDKSVK